MPDMSGLEIARRLRLEVPKVKILVISQHDPAQLLPLVIQAGGDGCLDKSCLGTDLSATIKSLRRGQRIQRALNQCQLQDVAMNLSVQK